MHISTLSLIHFARIKNHRRTKTSGKRKISSGEEFWKFSKWETPSRVVLPTAWRANTSEKGAKVGSEWFSLRLLNSPRGEFDFLPWESISPLRNETTSCSFSHSPTLPQYRPTDFSYSPFSPLPIYAISRCRPGNPVNLLREEESLRSPRLHQDWFLIFGRRIIFERGIWIFLFNDQFFRNFLFMNVYENNNVKTSDVSWL